MFVMFVFDVGFVRFMLVFCFRCGLLTLTLIVDCLLRLVNSVVYKFAFCVACFRLV